MQWYKLDCSLKSDGDTAALVTLLKLTVDGDRCALSPRIRTLNAWGAPGSRSRRALGRSTARCAGCRERIPAPFGAVLPQTLCNVRWTRVLQERRAKLRQGSAGQTPSCSKSRSNFQWSVDCAKKPWGKLRFRHFVRPSYRCPSKLNRQQPLE
jgi:hypothetical protein